MKVKFRVFDKEEQSMKDVLGITLDGDDLWEVAPDGECWQTNKGQFELMQYTGLTDKNGVEIFEGDVLEIEGHPFQRHTGEMSGMPVGIDIDGRYVIEYVQENAGYVVGGWKTREVINYCKIIGNIHEHSHLLEEDN